MMDNRPIIESLSIDMVKYLFEGDEPGHPFRGNQYVGGEGGSGKGTEKKPWQMTKVEGIAANKRIAVPSYSEPNPSTAEVAFAGKQEGFIYRGTETEAELNNILTTGKIESSSETAIRLKKGQHEGMTFYSDQPHVATSYVQRDGYVMELDRKKVPGLISQGAGELSTKEATPASAIKRIIRIGRDTSGVYAIDVTKEVLKDYPDLQKQPKTESLIRRRSMDNQKTMIEQLAQDVVKALFEGDLPGHPFHGNQWTGGLHATLGATAGHILRNQKGGVTSALFRLARMSATARAVSSGNPVKMARRAANILIGRKVARRLFLKGSRRKKSWWQV